MGMMPWMMCKYVIMWWKNDDGECIGFEFTSC